MTPALRRLGLVVLVASLALAGCAAPEESTPGVNDSNNMTPSPTQQLDGTMVVTDGTNKTGSTNMTNMTDTST